VVAPEPEPVEEEDTLQARTGDPDTSHASMAAYDRERLTRAMGVVIALHKREGPLADFELKALFTAEYPEPCCDHLYRQARSMARDKGHIRDSGQRKVNPTTKQQQVVWEWCDGEPIAIPLCPLCGHVLRRPQ
jgi:hypothetical protein